MVSKIYFTTVFANNCLRYVRHIMTTGGWLPRSMSIYNQFHVNYTYNCRNIHLKWPPQWSRPPTTMGTSTHSAGVWGEMDSHWPPEHLAAWTGTTHLWQPNGVFVIRHPWSVMTHGVLLSWGAKPDMGTETLWNMPVALDTIITFESASWYSVVYVDSVSTWGPFY